MTLLSYQLPVKWCRYQYSKLVNEFLANLLLYLPYRKCFLNADLTYPAEAATSVACVRLTNDPSGRPMSACDQQPTIHKPYWCEGVSLLDGLAREISLYAVAEFTELSR